MKNIINRVIRCFCLNEHMLKRCCNPQQDPSEVVQFHYFSHENVYNSCIINFVNLILLYSFQLFSFSFILMLSRYLKQTPSTVQIQRIQDEQDNIWLVTSIYCPLFRSLVGFMCEVFSKANLDSHKSDRKFRLGRQKSKVA